MTDVSETGADATKRAFDAALNRQGYPFQYAVIEEARKLFESTPSRSRFVPQAAEFPVVIQGEATSIDFVLKHAESHFFLACECKRANPALADWCFLRTPFVRPGASDKSLVVDGLATHERPDVDANLRSVVRRRSEEFQTAHIALEVKRGDVKGDAVGGSRGAIDVAATQVMRGLNGLIEFARSRLELCFGTNPPHGTQTVVFLPVIFTTAAIFFCDVDLSTTELASGRVDLTGARFERCDWLALQYHQTPNLKHSASVIGPRPGRTLGEVLETEFIRTIPIVSPDGIGSFLRWASDLDWY